MDREGLNRRVQATGTVVAYPTYKVLKVVGYVLLLHLQ